MGESTLEVFNKSLISETLPISFIFEYKLWASVLLAGNWGPTAPTRSTVQSISTHSPTLSPDSGYLRAFINLMVMSGDPLIPKKSTKKKKYIYMLIRAQSRLDM